ncbi:hypothetical protein ONF77_004530 [Vibrio parahaemolyticus]|nr:hypothetical protein [Vibrio parahaemolyticus]EME0849450.1 hypothetical protein [Vibrio parahaemolyticus]
MSKNSAAFSVAKRELSAAERHLKKMKECDSFEDMDIEWRGFLVSIEKVWKKIERAGVAVNQGRFSQFQKPYKLQKKHDRLLSYILHARNSDEHSVQEVSGYLSHYSFVPMGIVSRGMGKPDVFVPINPSGKPSTQMDMKFELVDVVDRGQTYSPPWGNQAPGPMSPIEAADTALNFYRNYMNAFTNEFGA